MPLLLRKDRTHPLWLPTPTFHVLRTPGPLPSPEFHRIAAANTSTRTHPSPPGHRNPKADPGPHSLRASVSSAPFVEPPVQVHGHTLQTSPGPPGRLQTQRGGGGNTSSGPWGNRACQTETLQTSEFQAVGYSHGVAGLGAWEVTSLSRAFSPLAYLDGAPTVCSSPILVFSFIHFPHSPNTGRVCATWTQRPREDPLSLSLVSQDSCSKGTHIWECDAGGIPANAGMGVGMGQHRGSRILQLCILGWTQTGGVLSDCAACGLHGTEVMNSSSGNAVSSRPTGSFYVLATPGYHLGCLKI